MKEKTSRKKVFSFFVSTSGLPYLCSQYANHSYYTDLFFTSHVDSVLDGKEE